MSKDVSFPNERLMFHLAQRRKNGSLIAFKLDMSLCWWSLWWPSFLDLTLQHRGEGGPWTFLVTVVVAVRMLGVNIHKSGSVAITAHAILFLAVLPSSTSIVRPKRLAAALGADSAWKLENFRAAFAFRRVPDAHDHGFLFEGALPRPHVRRRILHAASWNL